MTEKESPPNSIAKYGPVAGLAVLGAAVASTYAYTYTNVNKLKKEQAELTEKILKLAESKGDQDVLADKLNRMYDNTQNIEKTFSNLAIDIKEIQSRLVLVEEFMLHMGFSVGGSHSQSSMDDTYGYRGRHKYEMRPNVPERSSDSGYPSRDRGEWVGRERGGGMPNNPPSNQPGDTRNRYGQSVDQGSTYTPQSRAESLLAGL